MTRSMIFALLSVGVLSACSGRIGGPSPQPGMSVAYSNSVGFTGVGGGDGPALSLQICDPLVQSCATSDGN